MFPIRRITMGGDVFRDEFSLAFDGSDDFIDFVDTNDLGTGDFTIAAWIKAADYADFYILSKYQTSATRWYLSINSSDKIAFYGNPETGDTFSITGTGTLTGDHLNNWVHVTVSHEREGNIRTFINGAFDNSASGSTVDLDNTASLVTACRNDGSSHVTGSISEIVMYDAALTDSQVATIHSGGEPYNHKEGVASGNLTAWWRMGDGVLDGFGDAQGIIGDETTATLGAQIIADGTFDTAVAESTSGTHWITEAGWVISGGSATYDGGGDSNTQLESVTNSSLIDGVVHKVNFTLTDTGGGGVYVRICGGSYSLIQGTGEKTVYLMAGTSTNRLTFETGHDDKAFTIDNVRVYAPSKAGLMVDMAVTDFEGDTHSEGPL